MRRPLLVVLLGLGALLGFGSGFHRLRWHQSVQRAAFERHVAEICVDAARSGQAPAQAPAAPRGPATGSGW